MSETLQQNQALEMSQEEINAQFAEMMMYMYESGYVPDDMTPSEMSSLMAEIDAVSGRAEEDYSLSPEDSKIFDGMTEALSDDSSEIFGLFDHMPPEIAPQQAEDMLTIFDALAPKEARGRPSESLVSEMTFGLGLENAAKMVRKSEKSEAEAGIDEVGSDTVQTESKNVESEEDKISDELTGTIDSTVGSNLATSPEYADVLAESETQLTNNQIGSNTFIAMLSASERNPDKSRRALWELHTSQEGAIDNQTYIALNTLHQLAENLRNDGASPEESEMMLRLEIERQVQITARGDGQGRSARLAIEASAAQYALELAPGTGLHDEMIVDAQSTAAKINSPGPIAP